MNWESQIKLRDFVALSFNGSLWGVRDSSSRPIFFEQSLVDAQAIPPDVETLLYFLELLPIFHLRLPNKWTSLSKQDLVRLEYMEDGHIIQKLHYFFRRIDV